MPTTSGTSTLPLEILRLTLEPTSTLWPAGGLVSTTLSFSTRVLFTFSMSPTARLTFFRAVVASSRLKPARSGTSTVVGPPDTLRVTLEPRGACSLACGFCSTTVPCSLVEDTSCTSGSRSAARILASAVSTGRSTTEGTVTVPAPAGGWSKRERPAITMRAIAPRTATTSST